MLWLQRNQVQEVQWKQKPGSSSLPAATWSLAYLPPSFFAHSSTLYNITIFSLCLQVLSA